MFDQERKGLEEKLSVFAEESFNVLGRDSRIIGIVILYDDNSISADLESSGEVEAETKEIWRSELERHGLNGESIGRAIRDFEKETNQVIFKILFHYPTVGGDVTLFLVLSDISGELFGLIDPLILAFPDEINRRAKYRYN